MNKFCVILIWILPLVQIAVLLPTINNELEEEITEPIVINKDLENEIHESNEEIILSTEATSSENTNEQLSIETTSQINDQEEEENVEEEEQTEITTTESTPPPVNPYTLILQNQIALTDLQIQTSKLFMETNLINKQTKNITSQCQNKIKTSFANVKVEIATQKIANAPAVCISQAKSDYKLQQKAASKTVGLCKSQVGTEIGNSRPEIWSLKISIENLEHQNQAISANCNAFGTVEENNMCKYQLANAIRTEIENLENHCNDVRDNILMSTTNVSDTLTECCNENLANAETQQKSIINSLRSCVAAQNELI